MDKSIVTAQYFNLHTMHGHHKLLGSHSKNHMYGIISKHLAEILFNSLLQDQLIIGERCKMLTKDAHQAKISVAS